MAQISEEQRRQMIAEAAYLRAEQRGFDGGDTLADWLAAEREVDSRLTKSPMSVSGLEERLAMANERLKTFRKKLAEMTSDAREEWEEDVEKLAKYRDRLRKRLKEIREKSDHAGEKAKVKAEEAWNEISAIIERLSRRKPGR